ncbi:hypothetical protein [Fimbriiglobus ruber]|uniref:Uncharacterized protein n=1 Tax=Fimbriiglobus ruber TaxID=1908690 RepID=A0A225D6W3_9BACT|nr:hypothetical protein [Fimbriiglobus ruber]OWK34268.1 hypothetical protein FRUB_10239 [Fimbriiglobus ruber]
MTLAAFHRMVLSIASWRYVRFWEAWRGDPAVMAIAIQGETDDPLLSDFSLEHLNGYGWIYKTLRTDAPVDDGTEPFPLGQQ